MNHDFKTAPNPIDWIYTHCSCFLRPPNSNLQLGNVTDHGNQQIMQNGINYRDISTNVEQRFKARAVIWPSCRFEIAGHKDIPTIIIGRRNGYKIPWIGLEVSFKSWSRSNDMVISQPFFSRFQKKKKLSKMWRNKLYIFWQPLFSHKRWEFRVFMSLNILFGKVCWAVSFCVTGIFSFANFNKRPVYHFRRYY